MFFLICPFLAYMSAKNVIFLGRLPVAFKFNQSNNVKKMYSLGEEKIEIALAIRRFQQAKKAESGVFLFLTSGFAAFICLRLLVLYCQIQTTRLIMFFITNFLGFKIIARTHRREDRTLKRGMRCSQKTTFQGSLLLPPSQ